MKDIVKALDNVYFRKTELNRKLIIWKNGDTNVSIADAVEDLVGACIDLWETRK